MMRGDHLLHPINSHLFPGLSLPGTALWLQLEEALEEKPGLIECKGDVGIIVETKHLWSVIDREATNICHVLLTKLNEIIFFLRNEQAQENCQLNLLNMHISVRVEYF